MAWRSYRVLIAAVAILLVCLTALIVFTNKKNSPAALGKKPAQIQRGGNKLPARETSPPPHPQYPMDDPGYPMMIPPSLPGTSEAEGTAVPGIAAIPPEGKEEVYSLPANAQPTRVHSLAEAGALGIAPNATGEVGVPRVHALPPEARTQVLPLNTQSVTAPIGTAGNVMGTPPGVLPDEVGRTKTVPVKKDKKAP